MQSRDKTLSVIIFLSDQQGYRYGESNVVEWDGYMCHKVNLSNLLSLSLPFKALPLYCLTSMMAEDVVVVAFTF